MPPPELDKARFQSVSEHRKNERGGAHMTSFSNQTVWITGASSGIGEGLAQVFAEKGARIVLSGRRIDALQTVADRLPAECFALPFEATDYDALDGVVEQAWQWAGKIDVLVNNAGISQRSFAIETDISVYNNLINVDLIAPITLTQLQLRRMADAGGAQIVAISSLAGQIGSPMRTGYCAAKHGLIGYMDALRAEVENEHNIKVTNVLPGSVATNVSRNAVTTDGSKRGVSDANIDGGDDPIDCARAIVEAVENQVPEFVYAKGMELELIKMRRSDPERLFKTMGSIADQILSEGLSK